MALTIYTIAYDELTVEVSREHLIEVCQLYYVMMQHCLVLICLMDLCGVDYLAYGLVNGKQKHATTYWF